MRLQQIPCHGVICPRIGLQDVGCIVKLPVSVESAVHPGHIHKSGSGFAYVVREYLLRDDHVVNRRENLIRAELAIEIYRHFLYPLIF